MQEPGTHLSHPADGRAADGTAEERAIALAGLMERLSEILCEETAAVRARAPASRIAELAAGKQALLQPYQQLSRALQDDPEGSAALPEEIRQRLKRQAGELARSCADNAEALRPAVEVQQTLIDIVAAAHTRNQQAGYGIPAGAAAPGYGRTGYSRAPQVRAAAAALNTRL